MFISQTASLSRLHLTLVIKSAPPYYAQQYCENKTTQNIFTDSMAVTTSFHVLHKL